jgi:hypothetical protein
MRDLWRVLKRDVGGVICTSRNIGESRWTFVVRMWLCAWCLLKACRLGVVGMFREQLGSAVTYEGRHCFINNWAGSAFPSLADGKGFYLEHAERSKVRNRITPKELLHRFVFGFSFYTSNWMGIEINNRLHP